MKKVLVIVSVLAAIFLAGCQQRTDFDACVEYYEKNVRGKPACRPYAKPCDETDLYDGGIGSLRSDQLWKHCKANIR